MKTTACSDVADCVWLTGEEAGAKLVELAADNTPLHMLVTKLRNSVSVERAHLLLQQVELRRRAAAKFTQPERMFFTRMGLQQATDEWIAAYKANRIDSVRAEASRPSAPIADLCCGIGGDLMAFAKAGPAFGVDCDPACAHFATVNSGTGVNCCDVTKASPADVAAWHIDPDRRATGQRTTALEAFEPDLATIERLLSQNPHAAIKLAPATVAPEEWNTRCELEWISRGRECRQLVAWHGNLARAPGAHSATIVSSDFALPPRTITGAANQHVPICENVDRFVFDVDPAVLAAHLKGALAAEHELFALSAGSTYLTGPQSIDDVALACFEVVDLLPLETSKLSRHLAGRGIGRLEIKKRGVEIDPEKLRHDLKLRGANAATLLIARVAERNVAILANRISRRPM